MMNDRMKRVQVTWVDSISPARRRWESIESADAEVDRTDMGCVFVGFLFKETKDSITLCLGYGVEDGEPFSVDGRFKIPKCAIKEIRELRIK